MFRPLGRGPGYGAVEAAWPSLDDWAECSTDGHLCQQVSPLCLSGSEQLEDDEPLCLEVNGNIEENILTSPHDA